MRTSTYITFHQKVPVVTTVPPSSSDLCGHGWSKQVCSCDTKPKKETKVNVEVDEGEEVELYECGCPLDNQACEQCDINGESTCVDCCDAAHCESCDSNMDAMSTTDVCDWHGEVCKDCCDCLYCESCFDHKGPDPENFCQYCVTGHDCCGCDCDNDSDSESGDGMGTIEVAPWTARGIVIEQSTISAKLCEDGNYDWTCHWEIDRKISPATAMADFYLLDGIAYKAFNGGRSVDNDPTCKVVAREARDAQDELVRRLDKSFRHYLDMIIGGELRHHRAVKSSVLQSGNREMAWSEWKLVRDKIGIEALTDAAQLFRDFGGNSYGGEPWAQATELLINRLTGKWDARTFVDRVFSAQHNGGSILNKIMWGENGMFNVNHMQGIGECHASNPPAYGALLAGASQSTRSLFAEWWKVSNEARRYVCEPMTKTPTVLDGMEFVDDRLTWSIERKQDGYPGWMQQVLSIRPRSHHFLYEMWENRRNRKNNITTGLDTDKAEEWQPFDSNFPQVSVKFGAVNTFNYHGYTMAMPSQLAFNEVKYKLMQWMSNINKGIGPCTDQCCIPPFKPNAPAFIANYTTTNISASTTLTAELMQAAYAKIKISTSVVEDDPIF